jgi:phospholipase A1
MKLINLKIFLIGTLFSNIGFANIDVEKVKARYSSMLKKDYVLMPHNGTYLLPISYNAAPNESPYSNFTNIEQFKDRGDYNRNLEAEFQFSFLALGARNVIGTDTNLFVGYTQKSWWQIYNSEWSRPFR